MHINFWYRYVLWVKIRHELIDAQNVLNVLSQYRLWSRFLHKISGPLLGAIIRHDLGLCARIPTRCRAHRFFVPCRSSAPFHACVSCIVGYGPQRSLPTLTLGQFEAYRRSPSYQLLVTTSPQNFRPYITFDNRDHRPAQASLSNTCDDLKKSSRNLTDGCVYTLPMMLMAILMPNPLAELGSLLGSC